LVEEQDRRFKGIRPLRLEAMLVHPDSLEQPLQLDQMLGGCSKVQEQLRLDGEREIRVKLFLLWR